jgi:hypothetical protein
MVDLADLVVGELNNFNVVLISQSFDRLRNNQLEH